MPEMTPERIAESGMRWSEVFSIRERALVILDKPEAVNGPNDWDWLRGLIVEVERLRADNAATLADNELDGEMMETIIRLKSENAELRKDKERLDWLEKIGFSTVNISGSRPHDAPGVHSWRGLKSSGWRWTAHWISSEYRGAREAIDAAIKRSA